MSTTHFRDQVHRFGLGLQNGTIPEHEKQERIAQLGYNLGQYVQVTNADGRAYWQVLAAALASNDFTELLRLVFFPKG